MNVVVVWWASDVTCLSRPPNQMGIASWSRRCAVICKIGHGPPEILFRFPALQPSQSPSESRRLELPRNRRLWCARCFGHRGVLCLHSPHPQRAASAGTLGRNHWGSWPPVAPPRRRPHLDTGGHHLVGPHNKSAHNNPAQSRPSPTAHRPSHRSSPSPPCPSCAT